MYRISMASLVAIAWAGTAAAQMESGYGSSPRIEPILKFEWEKFDGGQQVDLTEFGAGLRLRWTPQLELNVGIARTQMEAFGGLDFGTTTGTINAKYEFAPGFKLGGYYQYHDTETPANFSPFHGYGLEVEYDTGPFGAGAYAGVLSGNNIATPSDNTTWGIWASYDITPQWSVGLSYQEDSLDFRALDTSTFNAEVAFTPDIAGDLDLKFYGKVGQHRINGTNYDTVGFGIKVEYGNDDRDMIDDIDIRSSALRATFSF